MTNDERAALYAEIQQMGIEQDADDARRYRRLCESGLPLCFEGREYQSKAELDAAIDGASS